MNVIKRIMATIAAGCLSLTVVLGLSAGRATAKAEDTAVYYKAEDIIGSSGWIVNASITSSLFDRVVFTNGSKDVTGSFQVATAFVGYEYSFKDLSDTVVLSFSCDTAGTVSFTTGDAFTLKDYTVKSLGSAGFSKLSVYRFLSVFHKTDKPERVVDDLAYPINLSGDYVNTYHYMETKISTPGVLTDWSNLENDTYYRIYFSDVTWHDGDSADEIDIPETDDAGCKLYGIIRFYTSTGASSSAIWLCFSYRSTGRFEFTIGLGSAVLGCNLNYAEYTDFVDFKFNTASFDTGFSGLTETFSDANVSIYKLTEAEPPVGDSSGDSEVPGDTTKPQRKSFTKIFAIVGAVALGCLIVGLVMGVKEKKR